MNCRVLLVAAITAVCFAVVPTVAQQQIRIEVENLQSNVGFFLTPVWFGVHDGSFDLFNNGSATSASLEALAEDGIVGLIQGDFSGAQPGGVQGVVTAAGGFPGAPVLDPGETGIVSVNVTNTSTNRYFSYASMVIPSNDAFIANDLETLFELFDAGGNFNGPMTINIFGAQIWDSGTEVNDTMGAAFSTVGGSSSDEMGLIGTHAGLANFLGTGTAAGTTIGSIPGSLTPLARISIFAVPEPTSAAFLALGGAAFLIRRRRIGTSG
jgi:hypothetical protein